MYITGCESSKLGVQSYDIMPKAPGPPPPTQYYLGYAYARSLPLKAPPYLRTDKISEPPFRGLFAGFSCLKDPPKSRTLLNVPPIFYFITPFLNFSGVQREIERERKKNHPFLKEISGWKVKYPPFLQFSGRTLSHEKYPFTGDFGNTHAVPPTPEWGGGAGLRPHLSIKTFSKHFNISKKYLRRKIYLYHNLEKIYLYHNLYCQAVSVWQLWQSRWSQYMSRQNDVETYC